MDKKTILSPPNQFSEGQRIEIDRERYVVYGIIPVNKYTDEILCVSEREYFQDKRDMIFWDQIHDGFNPYELPF